MRKFMRKLLFASLLLIGTGAAAQDVVSGVVLSDDDNTPLRNVTVLVKGTKTGTKTNEVGHFSITVTKGQVLQFSYIDYVRQEITYTDKTTINVKLVKSDKQLGEVVVTAYGTKRNKRDIGYTVQEVKGEEIAQTQRDNWINALAGRVAGANITPTSGVAGASTSIVLRGAVSIGGNNQPLFVVDGIPYDNQTMNQENLASGNSVSLGNRTSDYGNRAMDINPEDIESVTILKGPEATALYGSDGASGAIVITTKKGKSGRSNVSYDNSFRWEKVYRFPETQRVYSRGANGIADPNALIAAGPGNQYAYFGPKYPANTKFFDNFGNFFQTGFTQKHNLSVDGGNDVTTYRFSANYTNQEGMVPFTGFERLAAKLTGTAKISPKVNLSTSFAYNASVTDKASKGAGGFLLNLMNFPADVDVRDYINTDGSRKLVRSASTSLTAEFDNPYWDVAKNRGKDKLDRITTNITLNIDPTKWLNLNATTGIDFYNQTGDFLYHPQSRFGFTTNGFYSIYEQKTKNLSNVFRATVKKKIQKFSNTLTLGFTNDDNQTTIEGQRGERFYETNFASINNTDPLSRDAKTTVLNVRKVRFFGNLLVGYNNIAYLSFAGSREGTSTLLSRNVDKDAFFNYGAATASVIVSDLPAVRDIKWLSYAKLRASFGTTGKGPYIPYIIDNAFQSQITTGGGYAYGVTGSNPGLRPEITKSLEIGAEMKFFKNRLSVDVTRYQLRSNDQIIPARISYGTGFILQYINGGLVENKGIEAIVNVVAVKSKKFNWDFTVNFDRNRGKVLELPKGLPTFYDSDTWVFGNMRSQVFPGSSITNLATFSLLRNTNGDVIISPTSGLPGSNNDFVVSGDRQPDFRIGLINNFSYKDFSLSFNLDFRKGGDVFNGNEMFAYLTGLSNRTLDRERPVIIKGVLADGLQNSNNPTQNNITVYPYYRSDYFNSSVASEGDFIETVNWMRLRDVTLTYRLPKNLVKKQKVFKSASVFVTGTDLFLVTNYTGADPSVNTNSAFARGAGGAGIDYGSLATPRGINVGCRLQF
jgi:ferric enterobactin receptor